MGRNDMDNQPIDISLESSYVSPLNTPLSEDISIQFFFQYLTANKKDSPLSAQFDNELSPVEKDELWNLMLERVGATNEQFVFDSLLHNRISSIRRLRLSDNTLICDCTKGFVHVPQGMHRLDALFKRMRDAFAHGRIGYSDGFFILEDKKNTLTGRIIISFDCLKQWKQTITNYIEEKHVTTTIR